MSSAFPTSSEGRLTAAPPPSLAKWKFAAVHAIADLAQAEQSEIVASAYGISNLSFGPDYLIPLPFDPRLMTKIAPAVAKAAEESGVAARPDSRYAGLRRSPATICVSQPAPS